MKKENKEKNKEENINKRENKFHKYLWYLIIFSLIGLLIEIIYCLISAKISNEFPTLILGPLCVIYGIGTIITIICLNRFKGHKVKLFILGSILGIVIEYIMSFILESIFGARLWNYSSARFNVNGRICIEHAIIWGILSVVTIDILKKYVDIFINKMQGKIRIVVDIIATIIIVITIMLTTWGIITYVVRAKDVMNGKNYTSNNNIIEKFQNEVFSNQIMEKIFSEIEIMNNEGNMIKIKNING